MIKSSLVARPVLIGEFILCLIYGLTNKLIDW